MDFDSLFDSSELPKVLSKAKTLSKKECKAVYNYMERIRPKRMIELGTHFGCSTLAFRLMSDWLDLNMEIHSSDIVDCVSVIPKTSFEFHLEDLTGRMKDTIYKYSPDFVFLDVHSFFLVLETMQECLMNKVDMLLHDVSFEHLDIKKRAWELPLLGELISSILWNKDLYEDDKLQVTCVRDRLGLAIVEMK